MFAVWNKELLTLRNFFVVTKKFLKAKFDYSTIEFRIDSSQLALACPLKFHNSAYASK